MKYPELNTISYSADQKMAPKAFKTMNTDLESSDNLFFKAKFQMAQEPAQPLSVTSMIPRPKNCRNTALISAISVAFTTYLCFCEPICYPHQRFTARITFSELIQWRSWVRSSLLNNHEILLAMHLCMHVLHYALCPGAGYYI